MIDHTHTIASSDTDTPVEKPKRKQSPETIEKRMKQIRGKKNVKLSNALKGKQSNALGKSWKQQNPRSEEERSYRSQIAKQYWKNLPPRIREEKIDKMQDNRTFQKRKKPIPHSPQQEAM